MIKFGFKRISMRLFWAFIMMAALTLLILWLVQAGLIRDGYESRKVESIENALKQAGNIDQSEITEIEEKTASTLLVIDSSGSIIYKSQGMPLMGMMQRVASGMLPLGDKSSLQYVQTSHAGIRYGILGFPMADGSAIFSIFSLADADEAALLLRQQLWLITLLLIVMATLLSIFFSRRLSKPIKAVTNAAGRIAAGEKNVQLAIPSQDEIGQLTAALNSLSKQLQQNEQLQKELIANVSHELRAPLSVIRGYAETVRDVSWPDEAKRTQHLNLISQESERLERIVKDILDYSRLQAGTGKLDITRFELLPLLENLISRYSQIAEKRSIGIKLKSSFVQVLFDRDRLEQVCANLLQNAIQYSYSATIIEIEVTSLNSSNYGVPALRLAISSQGDTIPQNELDLIWERYHRSNQLHSDNVIGTGLGLAIVRSILEQHNVDFGVSSQAGQTTFWFDLLQG